MMNYGVRIPLTTAIDFIVRANSPEEAIKKLLEDHEFLDWEYARCNIMEQLEEQSTDIPFLSVYGGQPFEHRVYEDYQDDPTSYYVVES